MVPTPHVERKNVASQTHRNVSLRACVCVAIYAWGSPTYKSRVESLGPSVDIDNANNAPSD